MGRHKGIKKEMRSFLIFCAALIFFVFALMPTQVDDFDLTSKECDELNHLWQTKYRTDFRFEGIWESEAFECPSQDAGMAKALFLLDTNRGGFSGGVPQFDFYAWLKKIDPKLGKTRLLNFAGLSHFETHRLDINVEKLLEGNPVTIAGILVHEARHLEEGYNSHVPCHYNRDLTCDSRLEEDLTSGGAYSYNILFLDELRNSPNTDRVVKRVAKKQMLNLIESRFNDVSPTALQNYALD